MGNIFDVILRIEEKLYVLGKKWIKQKRNNVTAVGEQIFRIKDFKSWLKYFIQSVFTLFLLN